MSANLPGVVITLNDLAEHVNARLAGQQMTMRLVVEDEAGNEVFIQPLPHKARWGEVVSIEVKLELEVI